MKEEKQKLMYLGLRGISFRRPEFGYTESMLSKLKGLSKGKIILDEPEKLGKEKPFLYDTIERYKDGFQRYETEVEFKGHQLFPHLVDIGSDMRTYTKKMDEKSISVIDLAGMVTSDLEKDFDLEPSSLGKHTYTQICRLDLKIPRIGIDIGELFWKRSWPLRSGYRSDSYFIFGVGQSNWSGLWASLRTTQDQELFCAPVDVYLDKKYLWDLYGDMFGKQGTIDKKLLSDPKYSPEDSLEVKIGGILAVK